ncbi:ABC transporter permease [Paenibacillus sp. NPDC057967]|uniref:ABC transporter permease n=1 Tax=Paenibacillus sp. NPDC057967 TaxID=3346293 RepID=UPI0036DB48CC
MNRMRWRLLTKQLLEQKSALIALIVLAILIVVALAAPLAAHDPNTIHLDKRLLPPSADHWFGTDDNGRDYFARALYGARVSLSVGVLAMLVSLVIGTTVGAISGYFGGKTDSLLMRSVDIGMSVPTFFLMLILNAYMRPNIVTIVLMIGLLSWMSISRIVRAETISVKEREYVLYARVSGQSAFRIITRHIIPSIVPTIIVAATVNIAGVIMMESALSFLGLGINPPHASWGSMLNNAKGHIGDHPTLALFPGLLILMTVLCFNYLGDVFRAAFEPKANRQ